MWSDQILRFYAELERPSVPEGVDILFPYHNEDVVDVMTQFYNKYYADDDERIFLLGINPGRYGSGVTGIPFTDPIRLDEVCGIENPFAKRYELSSKFVYEVVEAYGGPEVFYRKFYFTAVCPVGFTRDGVNLNYYDEVELQSAVEPYIVEKLWAQIDEKAHRQVAYVLGKGQNFKYFKKLNDKHGFFDRIDTVPHPRWVLQYQMKNKMKHIGRYLELGR